MEPKDYTLIKIEGEYAYLRPDDGGEDVFIALMLLPFGVDIGTRLHCEMFEYTLIDYFHLLKFTFVLFCFIFI